MRLSLIPALLLTATLAQAQPLALVQVDGLVPEPRAQDYDSRDEPLCAGDARPPETLAEQALTGRGWLLTDPALVEGDTRVVPAADAQVGSCRFWGTSVFVFRRDRLLGLIQTEDPQAYLTLRLQSPALLVVDARYRNPDDAQCCPSGELSVRYRITDEGVSALSP
ncbi:MAG: LppP/LprE family lipoprotein [Xanthomonadales bacterium]|nr:LppP/LprE family lipoprotein [Xanthomonadales bacterium]